MDWQKVRSKAEQIIEREKEKGIPERIMDKDVLDKIFHELQVHQIELDLQNEEMIKLQDDLVESRNKFMELYDFAPVAYVTLDEKGIIKQINLTGSQLLDVDRIFLVNKPLILHIDHQDHKNFFNHIESVFKEQQAQKTVIQFSTKSGSSFHGLLSSIYKYDKKNHLPYCWSTISDISERVKQEKKLKEANQKAEMANRSKDVFLTNISHEMRTPMNAVIGLADLYFLTDDTKEKERYVATIKKSGRQLLTLLNEILDLSKLEAGHIDFEKQNIEIRRLVDDMLDLFAVQALEKGLTLNAIVDHRLPKYFISDAGKIRQVLMNLISNAIKFTSQGDVWLTVDTAQNADSFQQFSAHEPVINFRVCDTGCGIPEKDQDYIFNSFTQLDGSISKKYSGIGLGLTLAKRITERLGGILNLSSEESKGSCFTLTIPMEKPGPGKEFNFKQEEKAGKAALFLHNPHEYDSMKQYLLYWGIEIFKIDSWKEFTAFISENPNSSLVFDMDALKKPWPNLEKNTGPIRTTLKENTIRIMDELQKQSINKTMMILDAPSLNFMDEFIVQYSLSYTQRPLHHHFIEKCMLQKTKEGEGKNKCEDDFESASIQIQGSLNQIAQSKKILIVEDNKVNQMVIQKMLKKIGYESDIAENGQAAIDYLSQNKPSLVLMDIQMPGIDGIEATRIIRDQTSSVLNHEIPIIAVTAHAMIGDEEKFLEHGMNAYLAKPFEVKDIKNILERVMN